MTEHLRTWKHGDYRLDLDFSGLIANRDYLRYVFRHKGRIIFAGDDYSPSPMHAVDSDEAVAGCLLFCALRPGDTDPEYFDRYTETQSSFAREHGETLALIVNDLEEGCRWMRDIVERVTDETALRLGDALVEGDDTMFGPLTDRLKELGEEALAELVERWHWARGEPCNCT